VYQKAPEFPQFEEWPKAAEYAKRMGDPSPPADETDKISAVRIPARRAPFWKRRPRLIIATFVMVGSYFLMPRWIPVQTHLLVAFDAGAIVFLAAIWAMMSRATPLTIRHRARIEDEGRYFILMATLAVAGAILIAIAFELHGIKELSVAATTVRVVIAVVTILLAWFFMNTVFAEHYAHEYYVDGPGPKPEPATGLMFPGGKTPDYWDFLYFSFVIGMTFQVSDVQIESHRLRRLALAHGIIAFFFNVVIVALTINILAGLI
jgi:uncharacterized membrane protein